MSSLPAGHHEQLAEGVSLYLGDCREILPTLGKVDAVRDRSAIRDWNYGRAAWVFSVAKLRLAGRMDQGKCCLG